MTVPQIHLTQQCITSLLLALETATEDLTGLCEIHGEKIGEMEDMRMCIVSQYVVALSLSSLRSLFLTREIIRDLPDQRAEHDGLIWSLNLMHVYEILIL